MRLVETVTIRKEMKGWPPNAETISVTQTMETRKMKIYIAGPMRGYPQFNFPAFYDAQEWLTAKGYETFNPAQSDKEHYGENVNNSATGDLADPAAQTGFSLREALGRDAAWITGHADALYMLTGWEKSTGAKAEWTLAVALGLQIFYQGGIEEFEWKEHFDENA